MRRAHVVVFEEGQETVPLEPLQLQWVNGLVELGHRDRRPRSRPLEEKAAAVRAFEREVVPGLAAGRLRPLVDSVYPAADVTSAFDRLGERGKLGKVLLDFTA